MLHILGLILKIIGILLLSILGIILLLLAAVLLIPIRYRASLKKESDLQIDGKVSWLFGALALVGTYDTAQFQMDLKLFGHSLLKRKPKQAKAKKKKKAESQNRLEMPEETEPDDLPELQKKPGQTSKPEEAKSSGQKNEPDETDPFERKTEPEPEGMKPAGQGNEPKLSKESLFERVKKKAEKKKRSAKNFFSKIKHGKEQIDTYMDFWNLEETRGARNHIWKEVKALLRHFAPRKMEGKLLIGLDDPALTGEILGILCVVSAFSGNQLEVDGDFQRQVLEGSLAINGHIRLCHIAKSAVALLADKNIRRTVKEFRGLTG